MRQKMIYCMVSKCMVSMMYNSLDCNCQCQSATYTLQFHSSHWHAGWKLLKWPQLQVTDTVSCHAHIANICKCFCKHNSLFTYVHNITFLCIYFLFVCVPSKETCKVQIHFLWPGRAWGVGAGLKNPQCGPCFSSSFDNVRQNNGKPFL